MNQKVEVKSTKIYYVQMEPEDNLPQIIIDFTNNPGVALKYLRDLKFVYPHFFQWFNNIVMPDLLTNNNGRAMLFAISDLHNTNPDESLVASDNKRLTGIAILKSNAEERKICTFRIFPEYRGQGIGSKLLEDCFDYLQTKKPLISIAKESVDAFRPFIQKYEWKLCQKLDNYYRKGSIEYVYNGSLTNNK